MQWTWLDSNRMKPIRRSKLRSYLGKKYFRLKRRVTWIRSGATYATTFDTEPYPHQVFRHQTLLRRQLKDVDMWYQENKIINLAIAIKQLHGIIIKPDETFSYWKLIGSTTKRKGYKEAMILHYGTFKGGIGGGLCQLSNLIYWMTLHTPLTVTERHRHSYDVFPDANRTQPFGSGATCAYNYLDLQIHNKTSHAYQLCLSLSETHLIGEWRALKSEPMTYQVYGKADRITYEHWGGYVRHNQIFRKVFNGSGEWIDDEYITENHALMMYDPLLPGDVS